MKFVLARSSTVVRKINHGGGGGGCVDQLPSADDFNGFKQALKAFDGWETVLLAVAFALSIIAFGSLELPAQLGGL